MSWVSAFSSLIIALLISLFIFKILFSSLRERIVSIYILLLFITNSKSFFNILIIFNKLSISSSSSKLRFSSFNLDGSIIFKLGLLEVIVLFKNFI